MAVGSKRPSSRRGSAPGGGTVNGALFFAAGAHGGQTRKDRRTPYIVHPVGVLRVLSSELHVTDPEILCAALLHDVVEDTPRTVSQVRVRFGPRVARWVAELSIPPEFHGPAVRDSLKTRLLVRAVQTASWPAVLIKLADRVDNLRDSANAYWNPSKQRSFRDQTRQMLRAVDRRYRSGPPPPASVAAPLREARQLVRSELVRGRSKGGPPAVGPALPRGTRRA